MPKFVRFGARLLNLDQIEDFQIHNDDPSEGNVRAWFKDGHVEFARMNVVDYIAFECAVCGDDWFDRDEVEARFARWGFDTNGFVRSTNTAEPDDGEAIGTGGTGEADAVAGEDQATDDALAREAEANRLYAEHEARAGRVPPVSGTHIDTTEAAEAFAELIAERGVQPDQPISNPSSSPVFEFVKMRATETFGLPEENGVFPFDATEVDPTTDDNLSAIERGAA